LAGWRMALEKNTMVRTRTGCGFMGPPNDQVLGSKHSYRCGRCRKETTEHRQGFQVVFKICRCDWRKKSGRARQSNRAAPGRIADAGAAGVAVVREDLRAGQPAGLGE